MPGPLLHMGAGITCPHTAPCGPITADVRVKATAMPVLLATDQFPVAGCLFQIPVPGGTKPSPCVVIKWAAPAVRVKVQGIPVLTALSAGVGTSLEQAPQGPAVIAGVQPRVQAT